MPKDEIPFDIERAILFGDAYYTRTRGQVIAKSSANYGVYDAAYCYKSDGKGGYQVQETNEVIKAISIIGRDERSLLMQAHPEIPWDSLGEKEYEVLQQKLKEKTQHECDMLRLSGDKHAEFVMSKEGNTAFLRMSKAPGKSLDDYLADNPNLSFAERIALAKQIAQVVEKMHANGICHLDLKPENIIYDEKTKKISIIDFGSAQLSTADLTKIPTIQRATTREFNPPDFNVSTAKQIDSYSLAGILQEVMGKPIPKRGGYDFDGLRNVHYLEKLTPAQINEREQVISVLKQLGHKNHDQRGEDFNALLKNESMKAWFNANKKILQSSDKPAVKELCAVMTSSNAAKDFDLISSLDKVLKEAIEKQTAPRISLGFLTINKWGGSDVLKAILKLPEEIQNKLNQDLLKQAEKLSVNVLKRQENVDLPSLKR